MSRVLIICRDVVGMNMAGPGIRYLELAKALSQYHKVIFLTLNKIAPQFVDVQNKDLEYARLTRSSLKKSLKSIDVIVTHGLVLHKYPFLSALDKPIVIDLYDPVLLENLEVDLAKGNKSRFLFHQYNLLVMCNQLRHGDFFICASERQRDFWMGMLTAMNRVNPISYNNDKTFYQLIDLVPFGIPSDPPIHTEAVLKGVYKTISEKDKVVLWGGGIWNWFDPMTLIRSFGKIVEKRQDIKLFFMGIKHPNPRIPKMKMCEDAVRLSKNMGLLDRYVFFNDWVPYDKRQNYILESDIGISLHFDTIETRFSARTRILDYIWGRLPIITTRGDEMSRLIEEFGMGMTVDYGDVNQLTQTLLEMVNDENRLEFYCKNIESVASRFTWEKMILPLKEFCDNPKRSQDKNLKDLTNFQRERIPFFPFFSAKISFLKAKRFWRDAEYGRFLKRMFSSEGKNERR